MQLQKTTYYRVQKSYCFWKLHIFRCGVISKQQCPSLPFLKFTNLCIRILVHASMGVQQPVNIHRPKKRSTFYSALVLEEIVTLGQINLGYFKLLGSTQSQRNVSLKKEK